MADLNWSVLADTELRDLAIRSVEQCRQDLALQYLKPTQISGLRRIATEQPRRVAEFAAHQSTRFGDEKEKEKDSTRAWRAFWGQIRAHCDDSLPAPGTLAWLGEQHLPADRRPPVFAADHRKTVEDRQLHKQKKKERKAWFETVWIPRAVPLFFEYFCVEFLSQQKLVSTD